MLHREQRIQRFQDDPQVSVLIVGAGINGIGVFWDLAMQGVDVLMVDRGDYCSGASAATSHMVHGGIRYLENGEFRLVREAVQERNRLIENAPHLVKPLATTFPIFKTFSGMLNAPLRFLGLRARPAERGAVVLKLGMVFYDFYTRAQKTVPRHVFMGREESLASFPGLNPDVISTATYYDAVMPSPERIAVELVTDAARAHPRAIPLNYASLYSAADDRIVLRDEIQGKPFSVIPKVVVNAAGPWIDLVNRALGKETAFIGGTKGSHLVLDHPPLRNAIGEHEFFFENEDGRFVLILPLGDRVLVGASDIRIDDPDSAVIVEEEVEYFLGMVRRVFPSITVSRQHIVFTYSGVRPLTRDSSAGTGQISRDHSIEEYESEHHPLYPVFSLVGGKWTTFRALAEQATDRILERLGIPRQVSTRGIRIGGGNGFPRTVEDREKWVAELAEDTGWTAERIAVLLDRYGTKAEELARQVPAKEDRPLLHYPEYGSREIAIIVRNEDVVHLDDFLLRRSMIGTLGRSSKEGLLELAEVIGSERGWGKPQIEQEVERTIDILRSRHRMDYARYLGD